MKNKKELKTTNDLSEQQEAALEIYFEKWKTIGLRSGILSDKDKASAENAITAIYVTNNLKIPAMIWVRSPNEAIKKLIELGDEEIRANPFGGAGFGQHDAGWLGFYDFFRTEMNLKEETEDLAHHIELAKCCGWWWPYENICVLSEIPTFISFDVEGNLHNEERSAIQYSDNFEIYLLNGVEVPDWLVMTAPDKLSINKILALKNVEQRLLAIKKFGAHNMLKELNGKMISKKGEEYELFEIVLEEQKEKLLKMKNPSEDKWHYEFVTPDIQTVDQALAWRIGWNTFKEPVAKT